MLVHSLHHEVLEEASPLTQFIVFLLLRALRIYITVKLILVVVGQLHVQLDHRQDQAFIRGGPIDAPVGEFSPLAEVVGRNFVIVVVILVVLNQNPVENATHHQSEKSDCLAQFFDLQDTLGGEPAADGGLQLLQGLNVWLLRFVYCATED